MSELSDGELSGWINMRPDFFTDLLSPRPPDTPASCHICAFREGISTNPILAGSYPALMNPSPAEALEIVQNPIVTSRGSSVCTDCYAGVYVLV